MKTITFTIFTTLLWLIVDIGATLHPLVTGSTSYKLEVVSWKLNLTSFELVYRILRGMEDC